MAYPVSAQFLNAMQNGGKTVALCNVLSGGTAVAGYTGLPVETGSLTVSRTATNRSTVTVTFTPTGLVPQSLSDVLAPTGNELQLFTGWQYQNGTTELIPLGVFPIATVTSTQNPTNTTLQLGCYDRSWSIGRRGLTAPYSVSAPLWTASTAYGVGAIVQPSPVTGRMYQAVIAGTSSSVQPTWPTVVNTKVTDGSVTWNCLGPVALPSLSNAIQSLIAYQSRTMPPFSYSLYSPSVTVYAPDVAWVQGTDPWQAAVNDLADAAGWELYFDRTGALVGKPVPDPTTTATTWTYADDGNGLLIESVSRVMSAESIGNDFTVIGNTNGNYTPPLSRAADTNTNSPTNINSAFGDIPRFVSNDLCTTQSATADSAALSLALSLGQADTLTMQVLPNAAIDVDDVISVTNEALGLNNALYVVDGFTLSLGPYGSMQLNLRSVV